MSRALCGLVAAALLGALFPASMAAFSVPEAASTRPLAPTVTQTVTQTAAPTATPALDVEVDFFDALNVNPHRRLETLARLERAVMEPNAAPRLVLLLGLNHLWIAAEGEVDPVERRRHSIVAIHHLRRAHALLPEDHRIPSWLHAAEFGLAVAEGRPDDATAARERLAALASDEPCFHAVGLAIVSFDEPRDSPIFRRAHEAMEASFACRGNNPSIVDTARWPHNVHAFLVALADFRMKSGDLPGAEMALVIAEARPGFQTWSRRSLVDERFAALESLRNNSVETVGPAIPTFVFAPAGSVSCIACHGR